MIPSVKEWPFTGLLLFEARRNIKVCAHALAWSCDDFTASQSKDDHGPRYHDGTEEQNEGNVLNVRKRLSDRARGSVHDLAVFLFHAQGHRRRTVHQDVDDQDLRRCKGNLPTQNQGADKEEQHGGDVG